MREDFLHYVWRYQHFLRPDLQTTSGEPVSVVEVGEPNLHGGPDFFNARIRIDGTLWAGHVEIHVSASEWHLHGHGTDPAYDNVILHVVLEEERNVVKMENNSHISKSMYGFLEEAY